jgi:hypothetical protein
MRATSTISVAVLAIFATSAPTYTTHHCPQHCNASQCNGETERWW